MTFDILIVEDEKKIRELLTDYFRAAGMNPIPVARGDKVLGVMETRTPDLILLDLMLPGTDGKTLCERIRSFSAIPIIMITARVGERDVLEGLALGADDYICKPFSPREAVARVRSVLRRSRNAFGALDLTKGPFRLDLPARQAFVADAPLQLTPTEFELLRVMMERPGHVFSRAQLVKEIQGYEVEGYERTIDTHIKNLRKKVASRLPDTKPISAVYGSGYKFSF